MAARGDCDDTNPGIHPGATDPAGDGIYQDCGGFEGPDPHLGFSTSTYTSVQAALDAAQPEGIVWVGPGTYSEVGISFRGKAVSLMATNMAASTKVGTSVSNSASTFIFDSSEGEDSVLDGFSISSRSTSAHGVGISLSGSSPTIANCTISSNTSSTYGGGVYMNMSVATLRYCQFSGNVSSSSHGGAIYMTQSDPTLIGCSFSGNSARGGGNGWAIFMDASSPVLTGCSFLNNYAESNGNAGAVYANGSPVFTDCSFNGNHAGGGGTLELRTGSALLTRCTISNSNSGTSGIGGAVVIFSATPVFEDCTFSNNTASGNSGGGFYIGDADGTRFDGCTFSQNASYANGGGVYLDSAEVLFSRCVFSSNTAGSGTSFLATQAGGGGIYVSSHSTLTVEDSYFTGNRGSYGAGVMVDYFADNAFFTNTSFITNSATSQGGGIYTFGKALTATNCVFRSNSSSYCGSGLGVVSASSENSPITLNNDLFTDHNGNGSALCLSSTGQLTITNCVLMNNRYALDVYGYAVIKNSIIDFNTRGLYVNPNHDGSVSASSSVLCQTDGSYSSGGQTSCYDPQFLAYDSNGKPTTAHLTANSRCINKGSSAILDPDESVSDLGIYGGPYGDGWDLDNDGYPDWFWPGSYLSAPAGFNPNDYDCDDESADVRICQ